MNGKIIIKKPFICVCYIKINGEIKILKNKFLQLPFGTYTINVGIEYSDTGDIGMDSGHSQWSDIEWAWNNDKKIIIDDSTTTIVIKRKWHLLRHITADAIIKK